MALSQENLEPLCNVNVLKTKRVRLVQEVIFENVMPSIEPFLLYCQADAIRSEKTKIDRIGKILDVLERLILGKQYGAFNAFILSLAGTQPDFFEILCQRSPTDTERDFCVRESGLRMRQAIEKTEHCPDSQLDEKIDFQYEYVELATDRGLQQGVELPHEYNRHIDDIHATRKNISACDWLMSNADEAYKKVSIYGRAGIGKSTTLQFFAKQWARGRWGVDFTMLFLLQLRFITTQTIAISTVELLQLYGLYDFPDHGSTPFSSWLRNCTSRILILIDGLDEIPGFAERMMNTPRIHDVLQKAHPIDLCINILRGDLLLGCTVISASRPFAGLSQLPADARAEILGLTSAKVTEYVERRHPEHVEDIMSVLRKNPILLSVCGITFYCMMITRLLSEGVTVLDEDVKTYTRLMSFIIVQYCSRKIYDSTFSIEVQSFFSKLSQLAYSGMFQLETNEGLAKLVFDEIDLAKANINQQDLEKIKKTGILQIIKRKIGRQESWTAEFFHLSAQELLSVAHLLSHPEIPYQTLSVMFDSGQFNLALRFLFGLHLDKQNKWVKQICTSVGASFGSDGIDSALSMLIDSHITRGVVKEKLEMFQLIYEAQWDKKAKEVVSHIVPDEELCIGHSTMTAIDLLAIDFVCQFSECIRSITLRHVQADDTLVKVLLSSLCARHRETLITLDLEHNIIGVAGVAAIAQGLGTHNSLNIQVLNLAANKFGAAGAVALSSMLASNDTLLDLIVDHAEIKEQGVKELAIGLNCNTRLRKLKMNYRHEDGSGAKTVAEMLRQNSSLEVLDLRWSVLGGNAIHLLGAGLHENSALTELCLCNSRIGDDGAESIARILRTNTSLLILDISGNQIGDESAEAIARSLVCNTSLRELNLSAQGSGLKRFMSDAGAIAMADMLLTNSSLVALSTYDNNICDAGAIQMAKMLLKNTRLEILNISCNEISDVGAIAIANAFCSTEDAGVEQRKTVHTPVSAENRENAGEDTPLIPEGPENDVEVRRWAWCGCLPSLCCEGAGVEYNTTQGAGADSTQYNTPQGAGVQQFNTSLRKLHIHGRCIRPACVKVLLNIRQHDTNLDIYV